MARMFSFSRAVSQPCPPLWEWGDQDARSQGVKKRRDGRYIEVDVQRTGIRRHLPIKLVQRRRLLRKLDTGVKLPVGAEAKDAEPQLVIGGRRVAAWLSRAAGQSAPRLIEQVHWIAVAQKDGLKALAAIRGGLPRFHRLPVAVPEDQRQRACVHGPLVQHEGVVAVQRLSGGGLRGRVERPVRNGIKGAGGGF